MPDHDIDELYYRMMILINRLRKTDLNEIFYDWSKEWEHDHWSLRSFNNSNHTLSELRKMIEFGTPNDHSPEMIQLVQIGAMFAQSNIERANRHIIINEIAFQISCYEKILAKRV